MATFFFFFFFKSGLKLDEKSIENGLEGQKFLVVCLFWGHNSHIGISICVITRFSSLALVRQLKDDMHPNNKLQRMVLDFNSLIRPPFSVLPSSKIYQGQGYLSWFDF